MSGFTQLEEYSIEGTFGDREVRLCRCVPYAPRGINVVVLHGVHSCANTTRLNKFRHLSNVIADKGLTPWLVETSRKVRNRQDYGDDVLSWVNDAFDGKTFPQEQEDVFRAIREVVQRTASAPLWLWGFSLGGIIALSASTGVIASPSAPAIEKIILSGTGLLSYPKIEESMMKLPILSTLRSTISPDLLSQVRTKGFISFRGSNDEIFPESSCRDLVNAISVRDKHFVVIDGSDHSMRVRDGKKCPAIMDEMVDFIAKTWL